MKPPHFSQFIKKSLKFRAKISRKILFIACNTKSLFIKEKFIKVWVWTLFITSSTIKTPIS
ncbi:hypothetical protein FIM70_04770 [Helicobacter pylori]|nr:hypothetical protein FIM70_04770 [Helicobacter pylori]